MDLYLAEGLVALVEGLAYWGVLRTGPLKALGMSLGLNLASLV